MINSPYMKRKLDRSVTERQRVVLVKVIEECSELIHAATKVLRHGFRRYNPDAPSMGVNEEQLACELNDVTESIERLLRVRPSILRRALQQAKRAVQGHVAGNGVTSK